MKDKEKFQEWKEMIDELIGDDCLKKTRKRLISSSRQALMCFAYKNTILTAHEIGELCGMDHSSVFHPLKNHASWMQSTDDKEVVYRAAFSLLASGGECISEKPKVKEELIDSTLVIKMRRQIKLLEKEIASLTNTLGKKDETIKNLRLRSGETVKEGKFFKPVNYSTEERKRMRPIGHDTKTRTQEVFTSKNGVRYY